MIKLNRQNKQQANSGLLHSLGLTRNERETFMKSTIKRHFRKRKKLQAQRSNVFYLENHKKKQCFYREYKWKTVRET